MLDTNIVIYTMRNSPPSVRDAFNRHHDQLAISSVTLMELIYGAERSAKPEYNLRKIEGLAARLSVLEYDNEAAAHTAEIRAHLADNGTPIGPYDVMIAGHARSSGLVVVTNNVREFERVEGLRLDNWVSAE